MEITPLPFDARLDAYEQRAVSLVDHWARGDRTAAQVIGRLHPQYRDLKIPWKVKGFDEANVLASPFSLEDSKLVVARGHDFRDWEALVAYVDSLQGSVLVFEAGVDAVINGHVGKLARLISEEPGLVHARSRRVTCFAPPVHRATLLHYMAANGVEGYRQRTPPNAVEVARTLLEAGAEVDSLAALYGGQCTTLSLLVSSSHPAAAGVQVELIDLLIDYGATLEPRGEGNWTSPVQTALLFGFIDAAQALVRRGATVNFVAAAGLGQEDAVLNGLHRASTAERHQAMALAAQLGQAAIVRALLAAGGDPNQFNPAGMHEHGTPLHHAAGGGHGEVVQVLVEAGARLDLVDKIWNSTPLGWAEHRGHANVVEMLRR